MQQDGVVVAQDPDEIQREIERTREELAQTFDAIADKVSPKRAMSRTTTKVKGRVAALAGPGDGSQLRVERVALVAGAILVVAFLLDRWRRHR